ncbi:hypothetical protein Tco_0777507 [Tanacetum coccineum]
MKGYGTDGVTIIPTQIFSVNNLILKKGQPEGPPFTAHMLAICNADAPVAFQAPRTSSDTKKKDSQGSEPEAKTGLRRKQSSKHTSESKLEATKTSFIIHSESASGRDASADSTAEADPGKSAPNDSIPQQQDKTKSASDGLKIVLTIPKTGKRASTIAKQVKEVSFEDTKFSASPSIEVYKEIKLEDLSKLVQNAQADFMDLDSIEDDPIIVVDESEEDDEEVHATSNVETEDTSAPKPLSPRFIFLTSSCEYGIVSFDFRLELVLIGLTFEYEHVVLASTRHRETATTVRKFTEMGRIPKNLLERVSQLH